MRDPGLVSGLSVPGLLISERAARPSDTILKGSAIYRPPMIPRLKFN